MTTFMKMLDNVISKKTESLKNGFRNHSVEETERDLLDLMITSAEKESDPISDAALKVTCPKYKDSGIFDIHPFFFKE